MLETLREQVGQNPAVYVSATVLLVALAAGFIVQGFGASSGSDSAYRHQLDRTVSAGAPAALEASKDSADAERKKITTVNLDLEVSDVETAQEDTKDIVERYEGRIESESIRRENGQEGRLTVGVPADNVSAFLGEVRDRWKVESLDRDTRDVTDRYTELSLELKNKRQELDRLEKLVNRTEEVDSLIKIQERMGELRSRIQFLENQLNDLDRRVEYTEIRISYEEPQPITTEFELRESLRDGYRGIFQSLNLMIVGLGYIAPFLVVILGIIYGRRFLKEKR